MRLSLLRSAAALGLAAVRLAAAVPPVLPLETYFGEPAMRAVQISPTGRYLTFLAPHNRRMNLAILDRETKKLSWLTSMTRESVVYYVWAKPDRILFSQQLEGRESYGIYAIDPDGGNLRIVRQLLQVDDSERIGDYDMPRDFISFLEKDPDSVLMMEMRGNSGLADPIKVNLRNGRTTRVALNDINARAWIADDTGALRIAICTDFEGPIRVLYRTTEKSPWQTLAEYRQELSLIFPEASPVEPHWKPICFAKDNRTLYVLSYLEHDKGAIRTYDPETKTFGPVIFTHPDVEPGDRLPIYRTGGLGLRKAFGGLEFEDGELVGVKYTSEKPMIRWLSSARAKLARDLDGALPNTSNGVVSRTADGRLLVVAAASDRDPGSFYLYDVDRAELSPLGPVRPEIKPTDMAEMRPIAFAARDGVNIPGYLTLPVGRPEKNLPLIVMPHGGPFGPRDVWGFDPQVQFLANRGYAVLQVNFRGSGGYGLEFQRGGYRQYGLRMQDDVTDGVKWAIAQGIADPARVGIFGASYGGYAVLAGLVFTPELYCCGVNYVGVADLELMMAKGTADFRMPRLVRDFVRTTRFDPAEDRAQIEATNPINFIERLRAPLLSAYGKNDPRVRLEHGAALEAKLRKYGKPHESLVEDGEGHGFRNVENRIEFFRQVEAFLEHNMAGGAPGAKSDRAVPREKIAP
jgi:dipeptidyl aminopeptidase/acylaminoacyl peptidase